MSTSQNIKEYETSADKKPKTTKKPIHDKPLRIKRKRFPEQASHILLRVITFVIEGNSISH